MRKFLSLPMALVLSVLFVSLYAFAQSSPAAQPANAVAAAAVQAAPAAPVVAQGGAAVPMSAGFIGVIVAIVLGFNSLLSAVQKVFAAMAKSEPGWLTSLSKIVLEIVKFLGSNPSV